MSSACPAISPGFRLQWEAVQNAHVLLYPEGMVRLNTSAGEILRRCDGSRTVAEITTELETAFHADALGAEVTGFLIFAVSQGWVRMATS